ncbi:MAG TPA: restriction endonuclease [Solirubrobacteraceae bacterium]
MIDYREYENGVTDVLRFIAGSDVEVHRDVRVPGRRSGVERQVDVLVRGSIFGLPNATLAVDCKLWKKKLDVADAGAFLSYLDDIGADLGMLVTTEGYTPAAKKLAQDARGVRAEVLTLRELEQWSPKGTIHVSYRLPAERAGDARAALVRAGLRVREDRSLEHRDDQIVLEAFRYPRGEGEPTLDEVAEEALTAVGLPVDVAASGTAIGGGTPAHRWLEVTDRGQATSLKILASTDAEVERELDRIAAEFHVIRETLGVIRPSDWPITDLFGLPPAT